MGVFLLFCLLLFLPTVKASDDSPWPMFRGGPRHTGRSPYQGVQEDNVKWSYNTGGMITFSSPAIGSNGIIYVGSKDNKLYALNPDGSLKWSYKINVSEASVAIDRVRSSPAIGSDGTVYIGSYSGKLYAFGSKKYTLMTSIGSGSGSISPSNGTYKKETEVTVTPRPAEGYKFDHWSGGHKENKSILVEMNSNKFITVYFKKIGMIESISVTISNTFSYIGGLFSGLFGAS